MYNDNINFENLKRVSHFNPLFYKSNRAYHDLYQTRKSQNNFQQKQKYNFSYIVIDSVEQINQNIFQCKSICPVFITQNQSFILIKGQNLWDFYRAKKQHEIILTQQQLCVLIKQIVQALIKLQQYEYNHNHMKQYAIYRLSPYSYQLIFHPKINSMLQLSQSNKYYWYDFYLSPQQLKTNEFHNYKYNVKDTIFSLGLLLLNVMNPQDFNRDVYSRNKYQINWQILNYKIKNSHRKYSQQLINLIQNCLKQYSIQRYGLKQIYQEILLIIQKGKYINLNYHNKITQLIKSKSKSKQKKASNKSSRQNSNSKEKNQQLNRINIKQQKKTQKKTILQNVKKWKQNHQNLNKQVYIPTKQKDHIKQKVQTICHFPEKQQIDQINFQRGTFGGDLKQLISNKIKYNKNFIQAPFDKKINLNQKLNIQHNLKQIKQNIDHQEIINLPSFGIDESQQKNYLNNKENKKKSHSKEKKSQKNLQHMDFIEFDQNYFNNLKKQIQNMYNQIKNNQKQIKMTINQCLQPLDKLQKIVAEQSPGIFIEGDIYFGNFKNGRRNGLGLQLFPEGQYYFGYFKDDLFHGQGFYFWNKNQYFLGMFENGKKKFGTLHGPTMKYTGFFNGQKKMNGIGKALYKLGEIYVGHWKNGKRDAIGEVIEILGDKFIGIWQKGKKNGIGQLTANNFPAEGYCIKAYWKNQQIKNNVLIQYANGNVYSGTLKDFQKHGKGQYKFQKGGWFKGTFYQDEATHGELLYKNCQKYIGSLKNMKRHGYGQYYYLDGTIKKGNWIEDVRVQKNISKESK